MPNARVYSQLTPRGPPDRGEYREAAGAFAQAVIKSVELIVQPGAKDSVGEMRVRVDWPRGQSEGGGWARKGETARATRTAGVEVAKVHVKALYFIGPTGN